MLKSRRHSSTVSKLGLSWDTLSGTSYLVAHEPTESWRAGEADCTERSSMPPVWAAKRSQGSGSACCGTLFAVLGADLGKLGRLD